MAKAMEKVNQKLEDIQEALLNDPDFLRQIVQGSLQQILEAEFEEYINAAPYERTEFRQGYRNGSFARKLRTRVGSIELKVLRDREGNFSTNLFSRYQRSEQAFVSAMMEMYLQGVSTRKVRRVVEELCGDSFSESTVSNINKQLDELLEKWRQRPIEGPYPYLVIDARYEDIRDGGVVKSKAVLLVVGIRESGHREILSVKIGESESYDSWMEVFRDLRERGLKGVRYVVSDDHKGLVRALKRVFYGVSWQRCQVHFIRNFMSKFSRKELKKYVKQLKDVFAAPDIDSARGRKENLVKMLIANRKNQVAEWLDEEIEWCFAVYSLPEEHRRRMRSTNMLERLNQELKRRTRVIRIFPDDNSCLRLVGTLCMECSENWLTGHRYLDMELLEEPEESLEIELADAV